MNIRTWGIFVPPSGAAREVMISVARTMSTMTEKISIIDCQSYQKTIEAMLIPESIDMAFDFWNQNWICKALEERWSHVLIGAMTPINVRTLKLFKQLQITLVHWFYEDFREIDHWKSHSSHYDIYCCIQKEPLASLIGSPYRFLPTAIESVPQTAIIPFEQKKFDMAFIGMPTPYRVEMILKIIDSGIKIAIAGPKWMGYETISKFVVVDGWVNDDTAKEIYNLSRMGLNVSKVNPCDDRSLNQISPRLFDMTASGTIPVSEKLPLGDFLFNEIKSINFSTADELITKLNESVVSNFTQSDLENNRQVITQKHTYKHRICQIIEWIEML